MYTALSGTCDQHSVIWLCRHNPSAKLWIVYHYLCSNIFVHPSFFVVNPTSPISIPTNMNSGLVVLRDLRPLSFWYTSRISTSSNLEIQQGEDRSGGLDPSNNREKQSGNRSINSLRGKLNAARTPTCPKAGFCRENILSNLKSYLITASSRSAMKCLDLVPIRRESQARVEIESHRNNAAIFG